MQAIPYSAGQGYLPTRGRTRRSQAPPRRRARPAQDAGVHLEAGERSESDYDVFLAKVVYCEMNHSTLRRGMLHTANERDREDGTLDGGHRSYDVK